ncbi:ABC transporter permease [Micromonospora sp. Rc5]|uniref:ATP-binding cassette domain-containing protein n=1 Tax=Micromonospora sp. Rc5 TaxID=1920666 RepID=UPI00098D49A1|nr:ABC transporter ATP-binding protein [Micromonospora sp. Rc5]OON33444.1 ABC transporter permease [Micromonospora sp. Rc5]
MSRGLLSAAWSLWRTSLRQDRRKAVTALVLVVAGAAAWPLVAIMLRVLFEAANAGRPVAASLAGVAVAVLLIAGLTLGHFAHIAYFELSELDVLHLHQELMDATNGSAGMAHFEQPEFADKVRILEEDVEQLRVGLQAVLTGVGLAVSMTLTTAVLASLHPLLLLLPLVAVPPLLAGRRAERMVDRSREASAESTRRALGLFRLATHAASGKELRVFGLEQEVRRRHGAFWQDATRRLWRTQAVASLVRMLGQLAFAGGYIAAVLLILRDAVAGRRGVGDVILVITIAAQVNQQVAAAVGALPGGEQPVLANLDLHLPAGATVAIVGDNGAGKTTLVKLVCGLLRPTAGRVLVDGVDLADLPLPGWRARIAAGFQDFVRLELPARRTVGVGDLPRLDDEPAVRAALERAGAGDLVGQLEAGLDTQLGREYADGAELSGGQWQKLALGRAFMRDDPLLVVLDEPAAALDAEAEHAMFERYRLQAARVAAATGAVSVFVSHRFSTVQLADLIVVLADGRVAELGGHADLIAADGLYAEMFELQARAYR